MPKIPETFRVLLGVGDVSVLDLLVPTRRSKSPMLNPVLELPCERRPRLVMHFWPSYSDEISSSSAVFMKDSSSDASTVASPLQEMIITPYKSMILNS